MKRSLLVMLVATTLVFLMGKAWASVAERIYTEGGVIMPVGGMIDSSKSQNDLNAARLGAAGTINHQADGANYSGLVGYEVSTRSWYNISVEMQATGANFRWDGEPLAAYDKITAERLGTTYISEEKQVQYFSGNLKARFKLGFLRPFAELCGGPMTVMNTQRTYRPWRNSDDRETTDETAMAGKLGGGIGFLILPSKLEDHVELVFSGAYVKGLSGNEVARMAYAYYGGSLKVKFF